MRFHAAALAVSIGIGLLATGCGEERCACPTADIRVDSAVLEADSGGSGIATRGGTVAFLLDAHRDRLTISGRKPITGNLVRPQGIGTVRAFMLDNPMPGVVTIWAAAGHGLPEFTYRLLVADAYLSPGEIDLRIGQVIAEYSETSPPNQPTAPALDPSLFTPVADWSPRLSGLMLSGLAPDRPIRAFRASAVGTQRISVPRSPQPDVIVIGP